MFFCEDICTVVGLHCAQVGSTRQKHTLAAMVQNVALLGLALIAISASIVALPVTQNKKDHKEAAESSTPATADVETALEYERYLREVVEALEADPEFRKKLDKAPEADIRVSRMGISLNYVFHILKRRCCHLLLNLHYLCRNTSISSRIILQKYFYKKSYKAIFITIILRLCSPFYLNV